MLVRAPYSFLFILAICCWFRHNAAVPLASQSSNRMQDAFKEKKIDSQPDVDDTVLDSSSIRKSKMLENEDDESEINAKSEESDENDENNEIPNASNVNRNVNVNSNREDITTVTEYGALEEMAKEEASTNCATGNKKNQRYSSSFFENITDQALTVEKEFHDVVGNNSKVKKSGSVHEGEDITLCWIEMTTIKEDKTMRPSKKLVIREYTISFENSATIPERYLECKRYEGEMTANDPDVGKTALFEVIDDDTRVSRVVNFTSVSHAGNITTWEYKKVKCGVGPVVSKNIMELNDGSKNPKKRVEIKVSPKRHQLTATTTDEEPCTESSEEKSSTPESTERNIGLSCEDDVCGPTVTSPSNPTEIGISEIAEEPVTKGESEEDHSLSSVTKSLTLPDGEVTRRSTFVPKISTTTQEYREKADCEENECLPQKHDTTSSEELFSDLSTTEATTKTSSIPISDKEITTKEQISLSSEEERPTETTQTSREEKKVTSDLMTEKITPSTIITDISIIFPKASETYDQSTDQAFVGDGSTSSEIDHDTGEYSKEGSGDFELSGEVDKVDRVPTSSMMTSGEVKPDGTTAIPITGFAEFTKEPDKSGTSMDNIETSDNELVEPPISIESGSAEVESSATSVDVTSEKGKESVTSAIEGTTVGKTFGEEGEFTLTTARTSPKKDGPTTFSPVSNEIGYSCENSEECMYITSSRACDESGDCDETTTGCESEECSEEVTDDESKFDTRLPITKAPPFATGSQSSEESTMIAIQHTTVANVATTTSREGEPAANIPFTMDTRRSTTTSTPQSKMFLTVKILLELFNEKEKQNLIEVEKHLSLDESPEHHDNSNLLEQIKALNHSINKETISALLNCTKLGNWIRDLNFVSKESAHVVGKPHLNDDELEFTDSYLEDSSSERLAPEYADARNDYSDYNEHEIALLQRRSRRSLDNEMARNRFVRQTLHNTTDSIAVDSFNITTPQAELTTDNSTFFTTTDHPEGETTENKRNVTKEGDESTTPTTTMNIVDFSNATESYDANLMREGVQLNTTTSKPEEKTSTIEYIENVYTKNEKNITSERNENGTTSLTKGYINTEKIMKVMQEIQKDIVSGLKKMMSQLTQSNLPAINNNTQAVKINMLDILADPKDSRIRRRRRAAMEEVGHWSNERIKEAPMSGNLRSLTEFTLYKVLP